MIKFVPMYLSTRETQDFEQFIQCINFKNNIPLQRWQTVQVS